MCWARRKVRTERGAGWWNEVERRARKMLIRRRERRRRRLGGWRVEKAGRKNVVSGWAEMMCKAGRRG